MTIESHGIDWQPNHSTKDTDKWIDQSFLGNPIQKASYKIEIKTRALFVELQKVKTKTHNK